MSGEIAEVVARLRAVVDRLDTSAVAATRAAADARQANNDFTVAGTGSNHQYVHVAVGSSSIAAAKADKIARLLTQAANHLAAYANHILPGSAPDRQATDAATPSGEELVAESRERAERRQKINGFLSKAVRKADDVQDQASQGVKAVEAVGKLFRHPHGSGTQSSGTTPPSAPPVVAPTKIDSGDVAGSLAVVGILTGVAVHRAVTSIKRQIARSRRVYNDQSQ